MTKLFNVLGFDDGVHTCDCCGKSDLKGTFGIEMLASGEILHYGSVCVTRNTGYAKKEINAMARAYEQERVKAAHAEFVASPEYATYQATWKAANKLCLPGLEFKNYCRAAAVAEGQARAAIAAKFGLQPYQV